MVGKRLEEEIRARGKYKKYGKNNDLDLGYHCLSPCEDLIISNVSRGTLYKNIPKDMTGKSEYISAHYNECLKKMEFVDKLEAVETAVYILHNGLSWVETRPSFSYTHPHAAKPIIVGLDIKTEIIRDSPNILPLDMCRYYHEEKWSEIVPVWQAQKEIREKLAMQAIWYNGAPQRYTWVDLPHKNNGSKVELEFEFTILETGVENLKVAVENMEQFTILCNGIEIYHKGHCLKGEFLLDPDFKIVDIPSDSLCIGRNILTMCVDYEHRMELEDIYLLGDFVVNANRELAKEDGKLKIGDWCGQGYPFYGGGLTYRFKTKKISTQERVGLFLDEWSAAVVEISVNNQIVGNIGWKGQDGIDITEYLKDENVIDIKVITTPRNIFGPFHQKYDSCVRSSFKDFRTEGDCFTDEYILEPQGLFKPITIQEI